MINYSIVMRGVNANLFEINLAKARIKLARNEGKEPEQADLDLVKTEVQNAFAIAQYTDVMTIEKFARHIATHGTVYSRADISAILYLAVDCMREQLLEGKKIRLGDLGDFYITLSSKGAETADKFSAQNITSVNVMWEPGMEFKNLLADAEFNLVASRNAQAAVLKAIKAGQTTVDLTVADTPSGSDSGSGSGSGSDSGSGSGSDSGSGNPSGGGTTDEGGVGDIGE
ncbi:MAG: DNA-binding protein [Prevotella sp.]|nr:DNA-binding protein [Prevotella sp.]